MKPLAVARALALAVVVDRLVRTRTVAAPITADPATAAPDDLPSITVVIPARDEGDSVGAAVASVVGARGVVEVIVVDDGSTDDTAELAAAAGARTMPAGSVPPGWVGKTWALERGVMAAGGDWVVTLDADTRAGVGLPLALVRRALADGADLVTVAGRFRGGSGGARWLHASMLTTLVYRYGAPGSSGRADRPIANGQCMAFDRQTFLARGGFGPVASSPVEDVALARHLGRAGGRVAFLDATALLDVESYPTLASTWRGWGRSLGLPGVESDLCRLADVAVLTLTMPMPLARWLSGRADAIDAVALGVRAGTLVGTRRAYAALGPAYWASPLADAAAVVAVAAGFRRRHRWKGRVVDLRGTPARTGDR